MMEQSEQINELAAALAEARPKFKPFAKDQTAKIVGPKGSYTYKYGDKSSLFDAVMPALNEAGLTLMQAPALADGKPVLVTQLAHKSGQWVRSAMPMHLYDRPQDTGSELTYLSRYAAQLLLGVAGEVDDDGASAQQGEQRQAPAAQAVPQSPGVTRTSAPVARPQAVNAPRAVPSARPRPMPVDEPPHPALTADDIPF